MGDGKLARRLLLTALMVVPVVAYGELLVTKSVSGELGYDYRQTRYSGSYTATHNMLTGRVITDSYVWQPWFVTMGLSLAVTQDKSVESNGNEASSRFLSGDFNMSALPMSRYPFSLRYSVGDSRIDTAADNNPLLSQSIARHFTRKNLQVSQGYSGNLFRFNFHYNNDEAKSDLGELYTQEGYGVDYSLRGSKQNLTANALYQKQSNNQNSNDSDSTVVSLNHNYYPSIYTNVDTVASHVRSNNYYTTSFTGLSQQLTSDIDQASVALGWRSSTMPLRVNGGVRAHQMDYMIDNSITTTSLQNSGVNSSVGASYQFSDRLLGSVNGQYSELRSGASEIYSHGEAANLGYTSERRELSGFDYGWNTALSAANQQSGESKSQSTMLTLGHGAGRSWMLESRDSVRLSLSQDLSDGYVYSTGPTTVTSMVGAEGETRRLGHSLSLGWQSNDQSGSSMAQLTMSDSRGIIGDKSTSQMVNAQLSRSQLLDNRSSVNGNLSWQAWRYTLTGTPDYGFGTTTSASASYRYARPFTLQRVTFVSDLRLSDIQPALGPSVQETLWDNRFTHEIGMMRSSLGLTYREHMTIRSTMLMLSVKRLF